MYDPEESAIAIPNVWSDVWCGSCRMCIMCPVSRNGYCIENAPNHMVRNFPDSLHCECTWVEHCNKLGLFYVWEMLVSAAITMFRFQLD